MSALRSARFLSLIGLAGTAGTYYMLQSKQRQQDWKGFVNSSTSAFLAATAISTCVFDYLYSLRGLPYDSEEYHSMRSQVHTRTARKILKLSVRNRGMYFKVGQYIGNLERIIPHEFTDILKVLQDSAPPLSFEEIRIVLDTDMPGWKDVFGNIEENAIAAASLAQVHKGKLKTGEDVAVKLQYPFLGVQTKGDFEVIRNIVIVCNWLLKWQHYEDLDFLQLYTTFYDMCSKELDFSIELSNAEKIRKEFQDFPQVYIPRVRLTQNYEQLSGKRMLTMEFVAGVKVNDGEGLEKAGMAKRDVTDLLIKTFAHMIFVTGNVHCDPHPGNILIRMDNKKPQIVLLDHGFYRTLEPKFKEVFSELWLALITFDYVTVQRISLNLGLKDYYRYLPLILTHRMMDSNNPLGSLLTKEEKRELHRRMEITFEKISRLLQLLPPDLMFIIRTSNLVALHNLALGGSMRQRLLIYTDFALENRYRNSLWRWVMRLRVWTTVFLFENVQWLYRWLFGRTTGVVGPNTIE